MFPLTGLRGGGTRGRGPRGTALQGVPTTLLPRQFPHIHPGPPYVCLQGLTSAWGI